MGYEIERKFLVIGNFRSYVFSSKRIVQGYLSSNLERSVRVRIKGSEGFLTIKGPSDSTGICRFEWETEIMVDDASELMKLCEPGVIDKIRHIVKVEGHDFEVDEFFGDNEGLIVAEIELGSVEEVFERPEWLGEEVTGDQKYYNSALSNHPYNSW